MKIQIASTVGTGPTELAAFDSALRNVGLADYNLIALSSVIPTDAKIQRDVVVASPDEYGHRLYLVMARDHVEEVGEECWAGLGWTQDSETGRGLFVEIHGGSRREVDENIDATLDSMKPARPYDFGENEREVVGIRCEGDPVCALVVAVYESESWAS